MMKRFFKWIAALSIFFSFASPEKLSAANASDKPNIVVILADDYGWGSLGCYGADTRLKTPNLDKLASQGRRFTQAYAPGSVCSPTRYALMTGRYFWRTSVKDGEVLPGNGPLHIETNRLTLASLAKSQGYTTGAFGKWHLGLGLAQKVDWTAPLKPGPLQVGFDYFFGLAANIGNQPGFIENEKLLGEAPGEVVSIEAGKDKGEKFSDPKIQKFAAAATPALTAKAIEWIKQNHDKKFFVYFAPNVVHEPVVPSADFKGSPFGKYGDFIEELDWSVGRILKTLDDLKLSENTLVIFSSDNGGVVHEQNPNANAAMKGGLKINGRLRGGKHDIWEGGFREPFIVRWPGQVPAGTTSDEIISLADVLASLAGILHAPLPAENAEDSFDVSAAWLGRGPSARNFMVMQDASANYAIRQGPWKLVERENAPVFKPRHEKAARKMEHSRKTESQHDELFNLEDDPSETKNVAAKHPNITERLRKLLKTAREKNSTRPSP